jgi:hypothetical protein
VFVLSCLSTQNPASFALAVSAATAASPLALSDTASG